MEIVGAAALGYLLAHQQGANLGSEVDLLIIMGVGVCHQKITALPIFSLH